MKKNKKFLVRYKTKQQLIKDSLIIIFSVLLLASIGISVVVLFATGIVPLDSGKDILMLIVAIFLSVAALLGLPILFYFGNWQYFNKEKYERKM